MRLLLIPLVACGCDLAGLDHDFPAPLASDVPFEIPAITVGDTVVLDVEPLFRGGGSLRYTANSGDTTVARAGMNREWGQTLTIHGLAPGCARVSLMARHPHGYDPIAGQAGWSATSGYVTRTAAVVVVEAGG